MSKVKKIPEEYTQDSFANLMFFGDYVNFGMQLDDLRDFLKEFQKYIEVTNHHLRTNRLTGYDEEQLGEMKERFEYSHGEILRNSIIISLYILIETELKGYCNNYCDYGNFKIRVSELKGDILSRFKVYCTKVIDLPFDFSSGLWEFIENLQELRNYLVHNNGELEGFNRQKTLRQFARSNSVITIDEDDNNGELEGFNRQKTLRQFARSNSVITIDEDDILDITFNGCYQAMDEIDRFFVTISELAMQRFPGRHGLKKADEYKLPIKK